MKPYVRLSATLQGGTYFERAKGREDYKSILARSGKGLDVKLLLSALQQSLEFELYLERRFNQAVKSSLIHAHCQERESLDTLSSKGDDRMLIFGKAISEAFEPYLSLYIDSQDQYSPLSVCLI